MARIFVKVYTFDGPPNTLVRITGTKNGAVRFDRNGKLRMIDAGNVGFITRIIARLAARYEHVVDKRELRRIDEVPGGNAPSGSSDKWEDD